MAKQQRFTLLCLLLSLLEGRSSAFQPETIPLKQRAFLPDIKHAFRPSNFNQGRQGKGTTTLRSAAATAAVAGVILPSVTKIALCTILPTSLGYAKVEYGVSYGYGTSVALLAFDILRQLPYGTTAYWHALALVFYGVRLNLFLLYREWTVPRFTKVRERIESKQGNKHRITRTPFVLGCAFLYACLAAPLFLTSQVNMAAGTVFSKFVIACVATTWIGFAAAALGDLQKSFVKAVLGPDTLVKGGIYKILRHPNYTGEILGWTASFVAAVAVAATEWQSRFVAPLGGSVLGCLGIYAVLVGATAGLEKKQKEKYGNEPGYDGWIQSSWSGPMKKRKD
jgi:steroid 5-alpha reductase family enzyme